MCGIFAFFYKPGFSCKSGKRSCKDVIVHNAMKIQHRGPDATNILHGATSGVNYTLVFYRLAINGVSPESGQPMSHPKDPKLILICNGEIYNYKSLISEYKLETEYRSGSDCEIILHLYKLFGLSGVVSRIKGEYAFILLDLNTGTVCASRDPYGVRSLYYAENAQCFGFASEGKALHRLFKRNEFSGKSPVDQFPNGTMYCKSLESNVMNMTQYYDFQATYQTYTEDNAARTLRKLFTSGVKSRMLCDRTTDTGAPALAAFLSGGFDSSSVAAILQDNMPEGTRLETYSIGFSTSPDLEKARLVADYIGSDHHEYIVTEQMALSFIIPTIRQFETYDPTTIRAGVFMIMLSLYLRTRSKAVAFYSGEGMDEASGSYIYFHKAPNDEAFHEEMLRLEKDLRYFDNKRGDNSSALAGLEIREPCLDQDFLQYYNTVSPKLKLRNGTEKYIMRLAMTSQYGLDRKGRQLLPDEIIWRPKEAMSNGVSHNDRDWATIIHEHIVKLEGSKPYSEYSASDLVHMERAYYLRIFLQFYPGCEHQLPYLWLPRWCGDVIDPSARVLDVYRG